MRFILLSLTCVGAFGCDDGDGVITADRGLDDGVVMTDGAVDAGVDQAVDAARDRGADQSVDAAVDRGPDRGMTGPPRLQIRRLQWSGGSAGRGQIILDYQGEAVRLRGRLTP